MVAVLALPVVSIVVITGARGQGGSSADSPPVVAAWYRRWCQVIRLATDGDGVQLLAVTAITITATTNTITNTITSLGDSVRLTIPRLRRRRRRQRHVLLV